MSAVSKLERDLVLAALHSKYGYDFCDYSQASFERRLAAIKTKFNIPSCTVLVSRLLKSEDFFYEMLPHLTVGTTQMFRDPEFYRALKQEVFPVLKTFASLNIWIAGCSTGEEVYSLAILLKEAGLYNRSVIFGTDLNPQALRAAKAGIYSPSSIRNHVANYIASGGTEEFSDYYTVDYGMVRMSDNLRDNLVFADHNLLADRIFTEAQLILCRNVLIYFEKATQNKVLNLLSESLRFDGYLALGTKESLRFSTVVNFFDATDIQQRIYRKRRRVGA